MNVKTILIKFKYGEEIICEAEDLGKEYFIKNVAMLVPTESQGWQLLTWMPYSKVKQGMTINKTDILFCVDLEDDMLKYYEKWKNILSGKKVEI